jgi:hypothetical protein
VIIDVDATLVTTKADKQDAAATYKRTYGHHPLLAMCAETSEVLSIMLRPGNAGSNTAADHVITLAAAIAQLAEDWQAGHLAGDHPTGVARSVLVRADAARASHWFAEECRDRNIGYSLGFYIDDRIRDALGARAGRGLVTRDRADDGAAPRSSSSPTWLTWMPGRRGPG